MTYDSIIIGAGPAGMVAALQMKRSGLDIVLFEKGEIGGLLRNANCVENYLGFPDGISGKELIRSFQDHLCKHKISIIREEVVEIGKEDAVFSVRTSGHTYLSSTVVIATGTVPKKAGIGGEEEFCGSRLFYEAADLPADGQQNTVLVIGGGDTAFDYALNLSGRGYVPTIVMRDTVSCLPLLKMRAEKRGIRTVEHMPVVRISLGAGQLEVQCASQCFQADYVLVAVGREPRYPRIATKSRRGLYYAGDVRSGQYRQVHIATGDALRVAMEITHSHSYSL
ncbi:MAG TPA: NAD(P)/FAD-dependent oxidoreductase [Candidatus Peribacteraceae bacterium]|nr:NAD(P)/FAD-dependent oxidoreductase [Candidatus Peribacteraceae bacterium]